MVNGVDYRIPMSAKGLDLSGLASNYMAGQQNKRQNELLELTQKQKEQEMAHLDDESRFKSIAGFAVQIKPFLDAGDHAGAQRVYNQRIAEIQSRGGNPSDSMELAPLLMSGDLESAKGLVDSVIGKAQQMGVLGGSSGMSEFQRESLALKERELDSKLNPPSDPAKGFDKEGRLRGEYVKGSGDFQKQNAAFGRIQAAAEDPSPAGDLALIFNYMKLLDPGSTVREGEFATAQGAMAALGREEESGGVVPNFVKSYVAQLTEGTRLLPEQRKDFYDRSSKLFGEATKQHELMKGRYSALAEGYGLNPGNVVIDLMTADPSRTINLGGSNPTPAPSKAIDYLRENDTPELRQQFKAKYGYLPEGM